MDEAEAQWRERLPKNSGDLLQWLFAQDVATLLQVLAFTAARSINALVPKQDQRATARLAACDVLADQIGLNPHGLCDGMTGWIISDGFPRRIC